MKRKNDPKVTASGSTSHYSLEYENNFETRPSFSGFQSFIKWFRKNERDRSIEKNSNSKYEPKKIAQISENGFSIDNCTAAANRQHNINLSNRNRPSSPSNCSFNDFTPSSSCDSIFSTATTSFAFIPPNQYRPYGSASEPKKLIAPGPITDTYRERLRIHQNAREQDKLLDLTLRKKYNIYDTETITSIDSLRENSNNNKYFTNLSLPYQSCNNRSSINSISGTKKNLARRTASDSTKDKTAGAYLHVKGKRKAPQPPILGAASVNTLTNTLSPGSTLKRKKRRAPPPPPIKIGNDENSSLFDDEEIKAIIEGRCTSNNSTYLPEYRTMDKSTNKVSQSSLEEKTVKVFNLQCTDTLKLERGQLRSNISENNDNKPTDYKNPPLSPSTISPRPWYKRSPASKDYSIPFKKEINLQTMEKRRMKYAEKELDSPMLPEVSYSRNSSIFEGFFSRASSHHDRSDETQEKRRSGIGMPNISELDREATEIVNKEKANVKAKLQAEREKYYEKADSKENVDINNGENEEERPASTKSLISKFENSSNPSKIRLNERETSKFKMIKQKSLTDEIPSTNKLEKNTNELKTCFVKNDLKDNKDNSIGNKIWICSYCTLENANWRLICEACERVKPPTNDVPNNQSLSTNNKNLEWLKAREQQRIDWETKAERVMKYFRPKEKPSHGLMKSTSETSIGKSAQFTKKNLPSLLSSPKLNTKQRKYTGRHSDMNPDIIRSPELTAKKSHSFVSTSDDPKIGLNDSSAVVTTVVPVFLAPNSENHDEKVQNLISSTKIIEMKLERNTPEKSMQQERKSSIENISKDKLLLEENNNLLEKEKERLREMIRVMNARALAEKYPAIKQNNAVVEPEKPKDEEVQKISNLNRLESTVTGAIKKTYRNTKPADKEISENSNFDVPKADKEKLLLKLPLHQKPQALMLPTPILELNEEDAKTPNEFVNISPFGISNKQIDLENGVDIPQKDESAITENTTGVENLNLNEISQKLNTAEGIEDFKATLRTTTKQFNNMNTMALNKILKNLESAISKGEHELAAKLAMDLAKMKVSISVTKQENNKAEVVSAEKQKMLPVTINIIVEGKISRTGPIQLSVSPTLSITELKEKIQNDLNIPIDSQKWILNNNLASDNKKFLSDYDVKDKSTIYLYVLDKVKEETKLTQIIDDEEEKGAKALPLKEEEISNGTLKVGWTCPLCTLINSPNRPGCVACSEKRPSSYIIPDKYKNLEDDNFEMPEELKRFLNDDIVEYTPRKIEKSNDLNRSSSNRKSAEIFNIIVQEHKIDTAESQQSKKETQYIVMPAAVSVTSPNITRNKYRGVDNFNPNLNKQVSISVFETQNVKVEPVHLKESSLASKTADPAPILSKLMEEQTLKHQHYSELLNLDTANAVPNVEDFECPVCFMKFKQGEGIILRDCLHTFCRECIENTVKFSEEAEVKCPFMDAIYSCDSFIQEREIKAIVTKDVYEQHLSVSLRIAEHKIENAFHCKTPHCRGWCIFEDNVNQFKCPICKITNCLTCQAVHEGLNCKQYQEGINNCESNAEATQTKDMLAEMIRKGDAMNCPICQITLMKKWGCDWLKCSMCKTEICWITRNVRWGPEGKGDTSAGCKCGVNGVKCHPKCNYCH